MQIEHASRHAPVASTPVTVETITVTVSVDDAVPAENGMTAAPE